MRVRVEHIVGQYRSIRGRVRALSRCVTTKEPSSAKNPVVAKVVVVLIDEEAVQALIHQNLWLVRGSPC